MYTLWNTQRARWYCTAAGVALLAVAPAPVSSAFTTHMFENFDGLILGPSIDEAPFSNAFTHTAPTGWIRDASGVPGVGDPDVGVHEWEGWSFANKAFWESTGPRLRDDFKLGQNILAIADSDSWNDLGDPGNTVGFYNTFLTTPFIDYTGAGVGGTKIAFDSSWAPDCCDDGERFNPNQNNQTAILKLIFPDGSSKEILHWESAKYLDVNGEPSENPLDPPNPDYKPANLNEHVVIDIKQHLADAGFNRARLEFGMTQAANDGWWAIDAVRAFSLSLIPGDMNVDGLVDERDVSAFALGIKSPIAYSNTYFGEFPVTRGSPDGTFDFDDIPWFVDQLGSSGVASAAEAVQAALAGVPEPSTLVLSFMLCSAIVGVRRRLPASRARF
jgi:hypothetical protein